MTKKEQVEFTNNYIQAVQSIIINEIEKDKIPASWDGFELRWYIEEAFKRGSFHRKDLSKRFKEYQNYKDTNSLSY